jgi:hypothetical protein
MAIKPTKPTVPPAPSRSNPGVDFSNKADVFAAFQAPFADYMDEIADFVDEMADDALAAAVGGDLPPLTGQAGKVLGVKEDESAAEFVDFPPDTVAALTTNGLVARTGAGTAAARTLTAGTGIVVTNGDGVADDPTVAADIATQAEAEAGTDNATLMTPLRVAQAVAVAVGAGTAGLAAGSVGSYALLNSLSVATRSSGATVAGSNLRYANTYTDGSSNVGYSTETPSGTWRLMGNTGNFNGTATSTNNVQASLWLRIS